MAGARLAASAATRADADACEAFPPPPSVIEMPSATSAIELCWTNARIELLNQNGGAKFNQRISGRTSFL